MKRDRCCCRRSGVRGRGQSTAVGGRGEEREQRARRVPGEGRPRGRPGAVRVDRVAGRSGRGRYAPATAPTATAAGLVGHRQLRDHRVAVGRAQRHGGGGGRRRAGGRPTRFAGVQHRRLGGRVAVRRQDGQRQEADRAPHGQLSGDQRRRTPTEPVSVPHNTGV